MWWSLSANLGGHHFQLILANQTLARANKKWRPTKLVPLCASFVTIFVLNADAQAASLDDIRVGHHGDKARIVFDLMEKPDIRTLSITGSGASLQFNLDAATNHQLKPFLSPDGFVRCVETIAASDQKSIIKIDFRAPAKQVRSFLISPSDENHFYRLVFDFVPDSVTENVPNKGLTQNSDIASNRGNENENVGTVHSSMAKVDSAIVKKNAKNYDQDNGGPKIQRQGDRRVIVGSDDGRFVLNQFHSAGPDVVKAFKHINVSSLNANRTWRSEIDTTLKLYEDQNYVTQMSIGFFDTKRPLILTRGGFGLGEFDRWRKNSVIDGSFSVRSISETFEYSLGAAVSETMLELRLSDDPALWIYEPLDNRNRIDRSSGFFQRLKATAFQNDDSKVWFQFSHADTGQAFRNYQSSNVAELYFEGGTLNSVAAMEMGETSLSIEKEVHDDAYFANNLNILRFAHGAFGVKATFENVEFRDDGLLLTSNEVLSARFSVGIAKLWADAPDWIPDEINFGASQRSAREATFFNSEDAVRRSFGVGVSKSGDHFNADVFVYWNERNDFSADLAFENDVEFGADFNYTLYFDDWDFSAYAVMSDLKQNRRFRRNGTERLLTGGVSFSKQFERLPDISINLDAFSFDGDYSADEYAFQNHDISMRFEAEISDALFPGLGRRMTNEKPLSVYLGAFRGWTLYDDTFGTSEREGETRLLLMLRSDR